MKRFSLALALLIGLAGQAFAAPASEKSVKELITLTKSRAMVDGMLGQLDAQMGQMTQQLLQGKNPTPAEQKAINNMQRKMSTLMKGELSWEKQEPFMIKTYTEVFNQEEIDGMMAFYKTPAGQAMINKMPLLTQKVMVQMQGKMMTIMPKIKQIADEFQSELMAARGK